jgi:peptide/nickel transport system substrate-binding protein
LGADGVYAKGGNRLSLRLGRRDPNPRRQSTNELFIEQCKDAGIELTDDPAADFNSVRLPASDYDIALFAWQATAALSPNTSIYITGGGQNWNAIDLPAVNDLFGKANANFDAKSRAAQMNEIDGLLWDDMSTLPLFQFQDMIAYSNTVSNVVYNGPLGVTWNANQWVVQA